MKARVFIILALFAVSSCFFFASVKEEKEEFNEKIKELEKELEKLRELYLEHLNKTQNDQILEEYGRKGVSALDQKVNIKYTKGILPNKFNVWLHNFGKNLNVNEELKTKIYDKLAEIKKDQTGEIMTEKFLFGGSQANNVEYILLLGKHDPETDKTSVAIAKVKTSLTISESILVVESATGKTTEKTVVVQPEDFKDDDIQLITSLCEYICITSLKSFFTK